MSELEHDAPPPDDTPPDDTPPDSLHDTPPGDAPPDDTPPGDAPSPDNEQESAALMEEIGKKLDALTKTVATRISTILGDEAVNFEVCDLCSYWNTPGWRMSGPLPQDLTAQLLHVLNQHAPSDYVTDTHSTVCSKCAGLGAVLSGSKAAGQELLPCIECQSRGWVATDDARGKGLGALKNGPAATGSPPSPGDAAMTPAAPVDTPEIRALKDAGYVIIAPISLASA